MDKYILCDKDNIVVEHEDETNNFTISFEVKEKFDTIKELFVEDMFFCLIKEATSVGLTRFSIPEI